MTTLSASYAAPSSRRWAADRGVLLLFLQLPLAAVLAGFVLQLVSLPVAGFGVFVGAAAFPAWVSHRSATTEGPHDAARHLHRHASRALGVVAAMTLAIMLAMLAGGLEAWALWRDMGTELTAEPHGSSWSLLAGGVVYTVAATCTMTSCFVAFAGRRRAVQGRMPE